MSKKVYAVIWPVLEITSLKISHGSFIHPIQWLLNRHRITIRPGNEAKSTINANNCDHLKFIEHVHLVIDLESSAKRGDISVKLKSPAGTQSTLLGKRPKDEFRTGFRLFTNWPMMSVHFWGESVSYHNKGAEWTLTVENSGDADCTLNGWKLIFYGTSINPRN